jgi:hypothetical protein
MGQGTRATEIKQRRTRKAKMKALRGKFKDAKSAPDKEKILTKAGRVAPWITEEQFKELMKA